jgi:outer membrane protein OmpA-like peptidoglycan-associated protein
MMAREAVQRAEDARVISLRRQDEERLAAERQAAADREAAAKAEQARAQAEAEAEARRRQQAEIARANSEQARLASEEAARRAAAEREAANRARAEADSARLAAESARQQAEAAKAAALAQQQQLALEADKARQAAAEADRLRQQAENDKTQLRQQLKDQLNLVLETRDSARGLIVNMSDVLFDTAKYTLKPEARERLARVSGIVLAHPSLKLEVEGHTDSVGSDEYNQTLSDNRANAVRSYLMTQGLKSEQISAVGFGESRPVASNDNAKGRQQNRRVEIVVSGEAIGTSATSPNN